jgi:hypothetical protein
MPDPTPTAKADDWNRRLDNPETLGEIEAAKQ